MTRHPYISTQSHHTRFSSRSLIAIKGDKTKYFQDINEEWLADKSRFACDGLKRQRLIAPMLRMPNGELQPVEWESALIAAAKNLQNAGGKVAAIAGSLADVESMVALKDVLQSLGSTAAATESKLPKESMGKRSTYIMNTPIAGRF